MSGCRISKVTCKKTGNVINVLHHRQSNHVSELILEGAQLAREMNATDVGLFMVNNEGITSTCYTTYNVPALVGSLEDLKLRILNGT